jgi:hypothetical protein
VSACEGSLSQRTRVAIGKRSPTPVAYVRVRVSRMSPFSCERHERRGSKARKAQKAVDGRRERQGVSCKPEDTIRYKNASRPASSSGSNAATNAHIRWGNTGRPGSGCNGGQVRRARLSAPFTAPLSQAFCVASRMTHLDHHRAHRLCDPQVGHVVRDLDPTRRRQFAAQRV